MQRDCTNSQKVILQLKTFIRVTKLPVSLYLGNEWHQSHPAFLWPPGTDQRQKNESAVVHFSLTPESLAVPMTVVYKTLGKSMYLPVWVVYGVFSVLYLFLFGLDLALALVLWIYIPLFYLFVLLWCTHQKKMFEIMVSFYAKRIIQTNKFLYIQY